MNLFNTIYGHERQIKLLQKMHTINNIPHTILFQGSKGIGKFKIAVTFACTLLCSKKNKPCGNCTDCLTIIKKQNLNTIIIKPEDASIKIKIKQIRSLKKEANFTSFNNKPKIVIIDEAEKLNIESINSLLKLLEEPPLNFYFIIICSNKDILPLTVYSRAFKVNFFNLSVKEIKNFLKDRNIDRDMVEVLSRLSSGIINIAISITKQELDFRNKVLEWLINLGDKTFETIYHICEELEKINKNDKKRLKLILWFLQTIIYDILIIKTSTLENVFYNVDMLEKLKKINYINIEKLVDIIILIEKFFVTLNTNINFRLASERMFIQIQEKLYMEGKWK